MSIWLSPTATMGIGMFGRGGPGSLGAGSGIITGFWEPEKMSRFMRSAMRPGDTRPAEVGRVGAKAAAKGDIAAAHAARINTRACMAADTFEGARPLQQNFSQLSFFSFPLSFIDF